MKHPEKELIEKCKKQVEESLNWLPSNQWRQRDYEFLLDIIEEKTKIKLSFSTIKRLWNPGSNITPQVNTLDALAKYLGYTDWSQYKIKNLSPNASLTPNNDHKPRIPKVRLFTMFGFLFLLMVILLVVVVIQKNAKPKMYPSNFSTTLSDTVLWEAPQTIKIRYQIKDTSLADYYIQTDTDTKLRLKLDKARNVFEYVCNVPGAYLVQVYENDSVIKKARFNVFTKTWTAFCQYIHRNRNSTFEIKDLHPQNGLLQVSLEQLKNQNADISDKQFITYYFIQDFKGLSADDFIFETRLKAVCASETKNPDIFICFTGINHNNFIPLSTKGNEYANVIRVGESKFFIPEYDFSNLVCNTLEWQEIKIINSNKNLQIYRNKILAFNGKYMGESGLFTGFIIYFINSGSIDYIRLGKPDQTMVYSEEFE